jgi:hypothetical protein
MLMHFKEHVTPMSMLSRRLFLTVLSAGTGFLLASSPAVLSGAADAAAAAREAALQPSLAPYVPTPQDVVERMLELAHVGKDDVVYDLGSGDGRLVITAATKNRNASRKPRPTPRKPACSRSSNSGSRMP